MANDEFGYKELTQQALRGVVREVIARTARAEALPGAHHFYISFRTDFPGVDIDADLARAHPEQMTIVLEHQFWDLAVDDEGFEVTLKFNRVPKFIRVPFAAITAFHDPSVEFALRFEPAEAAPDAPPPPAARSEDHDDDEAPRTGEVVSLDAFRKKTD